MYQLEPIFEQLARAHSVANIAECMEGFAARHGFCWWSIAALPDLPGEARVLLASRGLRGVSHWPRAGLREEVGVPRNVFAPFVWRLPSGAALDDLGGGVAMPSDLPVCGVAIMYYLQGKYRGVIEFLSKDSSTPDLEGASREMPLLSALVSDSVALRGLWDYGPGPAISLSAREREALRLTMDDRTAREVGIYMGISERTAVKHLQSACDKLECGSKYLAVRKALALGLIG